jgi:maleylacetoacetate isomerase
LARNPQGLVPTLLDDDATIIQSTAICEYLEEVWPTPPLLPAAPLQRAYVRSIMATVACEIHPLNNLRVLDYLTDDLGISEEQKLAWYRHWVTKGLSALEQLVADQGYAGRFCCGDAPGLADAFLIPQIFNARRFGIELPSFPRLQAIDQASIDLPAFRAAHPTQQPDFPGE